MKRGFIGIALALGGFLSGTLAAHAAEAERANEPTWWFGVAAGANLNFYGGTTQQLNENVTTLTPFHEGRGAGLYVAPVLEYRPGPVWGGMLHLAYDDRRGDFADVTCPCGEEGKLSARPAYLSIEPSLRYAPFAGDLHLFAGPRIGFLAPWGDAKTFEHTRVGISSSEGEFSQMRGVVFSGQAGMGYDFEWAPARSTRRIQLSPFVSYHPRFGQNPRSNGDLIDRWGLETIRVGVALKFGRARLAVPPPPKVGFSVRAPATVVTARRIQETFPLRNYVFFDEGSDQLAARYTRLARAQAENFREEQLQDSFPARPTGRPARQIAVYRHLLNIMGDRLRRNPGTNILLTGLSAQGAAHGRARAETVKRYLVETFGIEAARIATVGRDPVYIAPGQRSAEELEMLRAENQRVEISSQSRALLVQIGEGAHFMLKPVEIRGEMPGMDSVVFLAPGAEKLASWMLEIRDARDTLTAPRRFGPYTSARVALPAPLLLGEHPRKSFQAVLIGSTRGAGGPAAGTRSGMELRREAPFTLSRRHSGIHQTNRFGILFDIDQARAVSSYERFLTEVVVAKIPDSGTVVIRGRTDVVGLTGHNLKLSQGRAEGVEGILREAVETRRRGVRFQTAWTGEDPRQAPFANGTPEERCYNRTVIIDILPE
jgi:outer membrane protein OmpA-like peptidoglycan-associated protein